MNSVSILGEGGKAEFRAESELSCFSPCNWCSDLLQRAWIHLFLVWLLGKKTQKELEKEQLLFCPSLSSLTSLWPHLPRPGQPLSAGEAPGGPACCVGGHLLSGSPRGLRSRPCSVACSRSAPCVDSRPALWLRCPGHCPLALPSCPPSPLPGSQPFLSCLPRVSPPRASQKPLFAGRCLLPCGVAR